MAQHQVTDAEYALALAAGRLEGEGEFRAQAVRYVPDRDAVEIVTTRNAGFLIPRQWIGALHDVPAKELAKLEVGPDGSAIELAVAAMFGFSLASPRCCLSLHHLITCNTKTH